MTDRDSLHALLDERAVERLHATYADVVNRRAWGELTDLFEPDATVHLDLVDRDPIVVTGPDALGEFLDGATARFAFFQFVVQTLLVAPPEPAEPDGRRSRLWMCEVRRDVDTLDWSTAYGLYRDTFRRRDGVWRFAARRYRSITRTGGPVHPLPDRID